MRPGTLDPGGTSQIVRNRMTEPAGARAWPSTTYFVPFRSLDVSTARPAIAIAMSALRRLSR